MGVGVATERSLSYKILAYSRDHALLDAITAEAPANWDMVTAVTPAAAIEELRLRHIDALLTDESALVLVIQDQLPGDPARSVIVSHFFKNEYSYTEFLREYREHYRELSEINADCLPIVLLDRSRDPFVREATGWVRAMVPYAAPKDLREAIAMLDQFLRERRNP